METRFYEAPECEVLEVKMEAALLQDGFSPEHILHVDESKADGRYKMKALCFQKIRMWYCRKGKNVYLCGR